ncbi:MAG: 2-polyprenyl-3-methyl-6-methoxy-1,4-benzoquinone monooxygenase [Pseudomonadota bacterium]|nr:MAG: 2-polyprenyl-3-methyl-6-methoxy-1,4-benzoquinone monooxygenase [Pseudomonadota bacterium]
MTTRTFSRTDLLLGGLDQALRTVFGPAPHAGRANPAATKLECELSDAQRAHVGGLMRINHTGEVCAQALYQGQAMTARLATVRDKMEQAAEEENDHLAWTAERIGEMGTHTSYLNPLWYLGSFAIGATAGAIGDKWSLGFVAETERQVVEHLTGHLGRLPPQDEKSRAILEQMREDEAQHATVAIESGAAELPTPIKRLMRLTSRVMTTVAYRI